MGGGWGVGGKLGAFWRSGRASEGPKKSNFCGSNMVTIFDPQTRGILECVWVFGMASEGSKRSNFCGSSMVTILTHKLGASWGACGGSGGLRRRSKRCGPVVLKFLRSSA